MKKLTSAQVFNQKGSNIMSARDDYFAKTKLQLDELNLTMDHLEAKANDVKHDVKDKYKEEVANLRHQSNMAVAKLNQLKASSEGTWDAMVAEMEKLRDAFKHSFAYFKSQI